MRVLISTKLLIMILFWCNFSWSTSASLPTVSIKYCYDGDTCTTLKGEKIRLACIDTPELKGKKANLVPAKLARDFLNDLIAKKEVSIRRITKDRYGRTVAELFKDGVNVQELIVKEGLGEIYQKYADQCEWSRGISVK